MVLDPKQNALILTPSVRFRAWLRKQPRDGAMFGASAVFKRSAGGRGERALASRAAASGGGAPRALRKAVAK